MEPGKPTPATNRSFSQSLLISMIILVIFFVSLMTVYDYINLKNNIDSEFTVFQNQTEDSVTAALRLDDLATTILDDQLNRQMMGGFVTALYRIRQFRGKPADMNLTKVKESLGEGYDIYIINKSGHCLYDLSSGKRGRFPGHPLFLHIPDKGQVIARFLPRSCCKGDTKYRQIPKVCLRVNTGSPICDGTWIFSTFFQFY